MQFLIGDAQVSIDIVAAIETFQQLEAEAKIVNRTPNAELLELVAQWLLVREGVEVPPSAAWQLWWVVYELENSARRAMQQDAELAFWYSIQPGTLSEKQRVGLLANLSRVKAQDTLHNGRFSSTDFNGVYGLVMAATGNKALAEKAKSDAAERYAEAEMRRNAKQNHG